MTSAYPIFKVVAISNIILDTCIGDAENIERKYPVIVREFSIRTGSGGLGRHTGGDGCVREIEFTRELDVAILSERRSIPPYGMRGGSPGQTGRNFWLRKEDDGTVTTIALGGKNECPMKPGDRIRIGKTVPILLRVVLINIPKKLPAGVDTVFLDLRKRRRVNCMGRSTVLLLRQERMEVFHR